MQIVNITDANVVELAVRAIHEAPIVVQLPTVFTLMAAPTTAGAAQLDQLKTRLAGKNYGTAIGSLRTFVAQASRSDLPDAFTRATHYRTLRGAFLRLPFRHPTFQSPTIRNGTHQGLLLGGPYARLFSRIEASFASYAPDPIWDGANYGAPLCTSCNVSGDPDGSIIAFDKALEFAQTRPIALFITTDKPARTKGSYPIFGFEKDRVSIHRDGPGLARFKDKIPLPLRGW